MHTGYPKISARERDLTPRYYYKRTRSYTCCQRLQNWIRKVIAFLFTQVGVCVLIGFYMIIGAFIFRSLEMGSRDELAEVALAHRHKFAFLLWNLTLETNTLYATHWIREADLLVRDFQSQVVHSVKAGYTGTEVGRDVWTFSAALMYSMTIFTTIGYGNLTPKTDLGKIATIFYALLGIPLMLLYMNNIGHILGTSFKYTYSKFCRCSGKPPSSHDFVGKSSLPSSLVEVSSLAGDEKRSSSRSKVSNSSTTNATLTYNSQEDEIENEFPDVIVPDHGKSREAKKKKLKLSNPLKSRKRSSSPKAAGNTVEFKLVEDIRLVTVPVTSCILVLIGYIIFGAVLFSAWERWDYMDGAYFCFTSLMTIGFGDFVPGNDYIYHVDAEQETAMEGKAKLVLGAIYILLGMALIAMCFNLMQEKIIMQLRTIARRLGLLRSNTIY